MITNWIGTSGASAIAFGSETNGGTVAGANDTVIGSGSRKYSFFTIGTAGKFYMITGLEWKNGTVVNGTCMSAVEWVDADPPTDDESLLVAYAREQTQTGAGAVQRTSDVVSDVMPGGRVMGAFIVSNSATARYGSTTVSSANNSKTVAYSVNPANQNGTAWSASTEEFYVKAYYKEVLLL